MKKNFTTLKCICIFIILGLCSLSKTDAQTAAQYGFTALSGTYTEITGGTGITGIQVDDGTSPAYNIGFTFNFAGTTYTQFRVCSNGWVTLSSSITSTAYNNNLTNLASIIPTLMPYWDDLDGEYGTPTYTLSGTAPNQVLTIQYKNWVTLGGGTSPLNFQVKLYQTTNVIEFVYQPGIPILSSSTATIGIAKTATDFLNLTSISTSPATSFTTLYTSLSGFPVSGQI